MSKVRTKISRRNKFYLSPHAFLTAYHYALQYNEWKTEYNLLLGIKGINYSSDRVVMGTNSDTTAMSAIKLENIKKKIDTIEKVAKTVAPDISEYLIKGVTEEVGYNYLRTIEYIPCGKDYYYKKRREFYYYLDKEINK